MKLLYIFALFCISTILHAQDTLPRILSTDIPQGKITRENTYDGSSLWGYMDGAADTYIEYGFDNMLVQEINSGGHRYRVEVFKMANKEAAFGIYSVSHYKQTRHDTLGAFNCVTKYQAQFPSGQFYVSIVNDEGSDEEQEVTLSLALLLKNRINGEALVLPAFFRDTAFVSAVPGLKFIKGRLGVQNGFPQLEGAFSSVEAYSFYALQKKSETGNELYALINFNEVGEMKLFCKKLGLSVGEEVRAKRVGKTLKVVRLLQNGSLLYFESTGDKAESGSLPDVLIK